MSTPAQMQRLLATGPASIAMSTAATPAALLLAAPPGDPSPSPSLLLKLPERYVADTAQVVLGRCW